MKNRFYIKIKIDVKTWKVTITSVILSLTFNSGNDTERSHGPNERERNVEPSLSKAEDRHANVEVLSRWLRSSLVKQASFREGILTLFFDRDFSSGFRETLYSENVLAERPRRFRNQRTFLRDRAAESPVSPIIFSSRKSWERRTIEFWWNTLTSKFPNGLMRRIWIDKEQTLTFFRK